MIIVLLGASGSGKSTIENELALKRLFHTRLGSQGMGK